jgi:tight adherence protein C
MPVEILAAVATVFLTVGLGTGLIVHRLLAADGGGRRRLKDVVVDKPTPVAAPLALDEEDAPLARSMVRFVPKSPKELTRLQRRLMRAGWHGLTPVVTYSLIEMGLPVLLAGGTIAALGPRAGWLPALALGVVGFLLPGFALSWRIESRKRLLANALPDALDLMIVCIEAGMALDQAIVKTSDELFISHPALAEELRLINSEIRAGKPRQEAFRNFAERTKVEDVRSLVAMIVQTDKFGTSIAQALRTFADVARTKRRQRAEERAAKLGVKLVFPLVLCLFPALYVVTIGPAIIQFVRIFLGQAVP